tara:strand:+ start:59 stop:517 length:459 start_codon:yes stop_codon:yes gene_type:complete
MGKNTVEYNHQYYSQNKDKWAGRNDYKATGKPVGRPSSGITREQYNIIENERQKQRYREQLSGYYHLYYRVDENYIGVTTSLDYRRRQHQCEIIEYSRFKHKLDALIVEAILQFDYGFGGWHRIHAPSKYKLAKQSHKRLATAISVRIFTGK